MLWDELAAEFGFKPLFAGIPGPVPASGPRRAWRDPPISRGATLHVEGLAADVLRALGATPVQLAPHELRAALSDGRIQAAEWLGPLAAAAPDLQPLAQRLYEPGFHRTACCCRWPCAETSGMAMSAADRAIFEACAAQEYQLSLAEARAHALLAAQIGTSAKWPVRLAWTDSVAEALDGALAEVLERIAATDPAPAASTTATRRSATCWART